jgi:hypothetical protein
MALAANNWVALISLWLTCGYSHQWVRYERGLVQLPDLRLWRRGPKLRVLPDLSAKTTGGGKGGHPDSMAEIDALLDKIARSGLSSLTAKERAKLEQGRERIQRRESGRD